MKSKTVASMKRIFSSVMLVAAVATAFFSCQKQEVIAPETEQEVMLTFASEKPAFDDETKTEWTGETIQWSKGDKIRVAYTCAGVWQNAEGNATAEEAEGEKTAKLYASNGLDAAKEVATFVVPDAFKLEEDGVYQFYGIYPSTLTSSTTINYAPSVTIDVPSEQTPTAKSFDAIADVMVAQSDTYNGMPKEGEDNGVISLKWSRLVAHGHLTLKALAVDGQEKIESIVLTANAEADMVGKHYVDFETQDVEKATDSATNIITIDGTNLSIDAEGNVSFWASFLPCTWKSLTVDVETNKASYTREIDLSSNQKTFLKNARNTLAIGMATATRIAKETPATDYSGSYVIVAKRDSDEKFYYLTGVDCGASTKRFVAELAGETCPTNVEDLDDTHKWEVSKSGDAYLVTCVAGGQISWTSGNSAFLADTGLPFVVAENEDGTFTFKYAASDGDRYISLNKTTGNNYFALYKSGQAMNLYLLPVTPDTTPKVTLEKSSLELAAEASEGTISVSTKYVSDVRVTALVEEGSQEVSEWLTADYADGVITYSALANDSDERTAYIEVYVNCEDGSSLSKGIVVTQAAFVLEPEVRVATVEEFLAAQENDVVYELTGVITSVTNTTYGNFYLNDSTSEVLIYGLCSPEGVEKYWATADVQVGDIITVRTKRTSHNGTPQGKNALFVSSVNFDINPTDINVKAEDTTTEFNLSCEVGYDIQYPDGVNQRSEVIDNNTASVTYSVEFPANTGAETKTYVIKIIADPNLILETPIEGVEYARNVTITQAAKPAEGEDAEPAWTLVTDVNDLAAGDQIVIVAKNANYAMSTTQNSNNRAHAAVTKDGNIITFGSDVQIMTLEVGNTSGTYAFNTGSGYLYAASSSKNYLRTETKLSANSSWTIAIATGGVATIKSTGSNTRNWLRYNSTNNPPIFSCYGSGQTDVCIYKLK